MSATAAAATAVQLVGGIALAPLVPGLVQHWKARLQGRRGPTPLQPYRDLRRLWGKSTVDVEGAGLVYRLAPSVAAGSVAVAVLLVPVASDDDPARQRLLVANALAQAQALMLGRSEASVRAELTASGLSPDEAARQAPHRTFPGDRTSPVASHVANCSDMWRLGTRLSRFARTDQGAGGHG